MTDLAAPSARRADDGVAPGSPSAARVQHPRWRDGRLVAGVLLVLLAVLAGARVLSGSGRTTAVLVAAQPLAAGHVLAAGDLAVTHIKLSGVDGRYWGGGALPGLSGHPLTTAVGGGDLLPRSAVAAAAAPAPMRVVSVPVDPDRLPGLRAGDLVDVFATTKATTGAAGVTQAVLRGVEYVGGGDSGSGNAVAIRLRVPVADTAALVRASEEATLDVVLQQPAGDDAGDVGDTPLTGLTPAGTSAATSR